MALIALTLLGVAFAVLALRWGVDSREDVDRMHGVVQGIGAKVLDAPADYPQYNNAAVTMRCSSPTRTA